MAAQGGGFKGLVGYALVAVGLVGGVKADAASRARAGARAAEAQAAPAPEGKVARLLDRVDAVQRRSKVLGFVFAVIKKFGDDGAGRLAALVAYYGFFSIFPLTMALSAILGLVLERNETWRVKVQDTLSGQVPFIGDKLSQGTLTGSGLALVVGLAVALWAGLSAIDAVQNGLNNVWAVPRVEWPNVVERRARSILMLVVVGGGLAAATVGTSLLSALPLGPFAGVGLAVASAAVNVGLYLVSFKVLCDRDLPWGALWPGAVLAGVGTWLLQNGFASFLLRNPDDAKGTYGDFASVIALLSWFFFIAQVTMFGAQINMVRHQKLWPRSLTGRNLTEADTRAYTAYARAETRIEGQQVDVRLP